MAKSAKKNVFLNTDFFENFIYPGKLKGFSETVKKIGGYGIAFSDKRPQNDVTPKTNFQPGPYKAYRRS